MRRLLVLVTGGLGLGVFWRRVRRSPSLPDPTLDHAAALRSKLAASKALEAEEPQPSISPGEASVDPASRRRTIHDRARGAIDELA